MIEASVICPHCERYARVIVTDVECTHGRLEECTFCGNPFLLRWKSEVQIVH